MNVVWSVLEADWHKRLYIAESNKMWRCRDAVLTGPLLPAEKSSLFIGMENGRGERIRTSDPLLPKQVRYQTALRPEPCG